MKTSIFIYISGFNTTPFMIIEKGIKPLKRISYRHKISRPLIVSLLIILWGIVINTSVFAGGRMVFVEYEHSRRIQNNKIIIELGSENNSGKIFYAKLSTRNLVQNDDFSIIERSISIDKDYFDNLYDKLLNLNFGDIIINNENILGTDGKTISVTIGTYQNNVKITLWSPDYKYIERKTDEINMIICELFTLFDMEEWL